MYKLFYAARARDSNEGDCDPYITATTMIVRSPYSYILGMVTLDFHPVYRFLRCSSSIIMDTNYFLTECKIERSAHQQLPKLPVFLFYATFIIFFFHLLIRAHCCKNGYPLHQKRPLKGNGTHLRRLKAIFLGLQSIKKVDCPFFKTVSASLFVNKFLFFPPLNPLPPLSKKKKLLFSHWMFNSFS